MKNTIITLFICFTIICNGQQKKNYSFKYGNEIIQYSKIDYSEYGIEHIFITTVEENETNQLVEIKASKYLERKLLIVDTTNYLSKTKYPQKEIKIYHTLYFFIKIPAKYTIEEKEEIFNGIVKEIQKNEFYPIKTNFYFNFDVDYSKRYISEISENNETKIVRILTGVNSKNCWKGLDIDRKYNGTMLVKKLK